MIETKDFIYFFNPHTGTRSMKGAWRQLGYEVPNHRQHHQNPREIPHDKPFLTHIREPIPWAYSFYWPRFMHTLHTHAKPETVEEVFLNKRLPTAAWAERQENTKKRLNIYHDSMDYFLRYEDGLETIFSQLGFLSPVLRKDGNNNHVKKIYFEKFSPNQIDADQKFLKDFFVDDVVFYAKWSAKWRNSSVKDVIGSSSRTAAADSDSALSADG